MTEKRNLWSLLPRRNDLFRTASDLYGYLVAQARQPAFYASLGAPDTPEGRLELIVLHVVLVLRRLKSEGQAGAELGRMLAEAFVRDMDDCLREMGVGDISVAKKVKKAAAALFDRSRDYGAALDDADDDALARLIATHLLETPPSEPSPAAAREIASYARKAEALLDGSPFTAIAAAKFGFPTLPG